MLLPLGENKAEYLEAQYYQTTKSLSVDELRELIHHYQEKNIRIYIESEVITQRSYGSSYDPRWAAICEMRHLSASLKEGEYVGYMYTNQITHGCHHFEAFLIGAECIIKPVYWQIVDRLDLHYHKIGKTAAANLNFFYDLECFPQTRDKVCGTLALSYMKSLLKNNAQQLKEFTLCIPHNQGKRKPKIYYFFFPSPEVLRYSQSELFNKYLVALLDPEGKEFLHKGKYHRIPPLKTHLENLIQELIKEPDPIHETIESPIKKPKEKHPKPSLNKEVILKEAQTLLEQLPDFTKRWLSRYEKIKTKRNQMQGPSYNEYLFYTSQRMHRIAQISIEKRSNSGLKILEELKQSALLGDSKEQQLLILKRSLVWLWQQSASTLGFFLSQLDEDLFNEALTLLPETAIRDVEHFREISFLLKPAQIKKLITHIKTNIQLFEHLLLQPQDKKASLAKILHWLKALRFAEKERIPTLKSHFNHEFLTAFCRESILAGELESLLGLGFDAQEALATFFTKYLQLKLILIPLLKSASLHKVKPLFKDETSYEAFLSTEISNVELQSVLHDPLEKPEKVTLIIKNYIQQFNPSLHSTLFFNIIEQNFLRQLLEKEPFALMELFKLFSPKKKAEDFLLEHRKTFIKALLKTHYLCIQWDIKTYVQKRIKEPLKFFSPLSDKALLFDYEQSFFGLLDEKNPDRWRILHNFAEIISFIPLEQRLSLVQEIFEPQYLPFLLEKKDLAKLILPQASQATMVLKSLGLFSTSRSSWSQSQVEEKGLGLG